MSSGFVHPNLKKLSYNSSVTLHRCPRKYELYKLLSLPRQDSDVHLDFGDAVGIGIQEMLTHGNKDKARFALFNAWKGFIDEEEGAKDKKTFWHALYSIEKFEMVQKTIFNHYILAELNGRPAIEVGFSIDLGDGYYYRGFIDGVFQDKRTNELIVLEDKTTKFKNVHEAMYKNSGQGLGYSLILDAVSRQLGLPLADNYKVIYSIYKSTAMEFEIMPFTKSHTSRALWIKQLLRDQITIDEYARDGFFPMHGETCYDFFRPCDYFGICEMSNQNLIRDIKDVPVKEDKIKSGLVETYDFEFNLTELIEAQLAKHSI